MTTPLTGARTVTAVDAKSLWKEALAKSRVRDVEFTTLSGDDLLPLYGPEDVELDHERDLGWPGQFPFTRGVHPSMYRGRLWTMRQFAGFGTAKEANERFKFLLDHGQTGLSIAFDFPTLMGHDSDESISRGEVGQVYNIGSGHEQTNLDTAKMILALMSGSSDLIQFVTDRPAHDRRYAMRDDKIRALGWQSQTSFEAGLNKTIAWYREHAAWWRPLVEKLREDPYHWLNRPSGSGAQQAIGADL